MARAYADLDVRFEGAAGAYTARVTDSPEGPTGAVAVPIPFTAVELGVLLKEVDPKRAAADVAGTTPAAVELGTGLFEALFRGPLRDALVGSAARHPDGLRIRLDLTDTPDLARLPWELMYDRAGQRFLALSERTPVVRSLLLPGTVSPFPVDGPLRVLAVLASPDEHEALDLDPEWAGIEAELATQVAAGAVVLDRLPQPTMPELHAYLRAHDVHVLHIVAHGGLDPTSGEGVVYLEGRDHRPREVTSRELGPVLYDHDPLRLVVLNACRTSSTTGPSVFSGLGQGLVQQRVPAVVAMQFEVSDGAGVCFARDFYSAMAAGQQVDQAVTGARKALRIEFPAEWATPVLFLRTADAFLFTRSEQVADPVADVVAAGVPVVGGVSPEPVLLTIGDDGHFVGGDRAQAVDAVIQLLDRPVSERAVEIRAVPLDDAEYRSGSPDQYLRLRGMVGAFERSLAKLFRGRVTYCVKWTAEELAEALLELRSIHLPARLDREEWYVWPNDDPSGALEVLLDPPKVTSIQTAYYATEAESDRGLRPSGVPDDEPVLLVYVSDHVVWERIVPTVVASLADADGEPVDLSAWVISNRPPTGLRRTSSSDPDRPGPATWSW